MNEKNVNKHWKRISQEIMSQDATDWKAAALQQAGIKKQIPKPEEASKTKLSQDIAVVKCTHFKRRVSYQFSIPNKPQCTILPGVWFVFCKHNQKDSKMPYQRMSKMGLMEEQPSDRNKR